MGRIILFAVIYAAILCAVQTMIFRKTERKLLRLLPLIVIAVMYLGAALMPLADWWTIETGRNDGYLFFTEMSWIVAGINTAGLAGIGAAWLYERV